MSSWMFQSNPAKDRTGPRSAEILGEGVGEWPVSPPWSVAKYFRPSGSTAKLICAGDPVFIRVREDDPEGIIACGYVLRVDRLHPHVVFQFDRRASAALFRAPIPLSWIQARLQTSHSSPACLDGLERALRAELVKRGATMSDDLGACGPFRLWMHQIKPTDHFDDDPAFPTTTANLFDHEFRRERVDWHVPQHGTDVRRGDVVLIRSKDRDESGVVALGRVIGAEMEGPGRKFVVFRPDLKASAALRRKPIPLAWIQELVNPKGHTKNNLVDLEPFRELVLQALFARGVELGRRASAGGADSAEVDAVAGSDPSPERMSGEDAAGHLPTGVDERARIVRQIAERRGQASFRKALRKAHGDVCMLSGCSVLDALEAAHISPYLGEKDNQPSNGLLLRADLHTLFDLHLIGIEPASLKVHVHPRARKGEYEALQGKSLERLRSALSQPALSSRWLRFLERR